MSNLPDDFINQVQEITATQECEYLAKVLWSRGIKDESKLRSLLDIRSHRPSSPFAWGEEITKAIELIDNAITDNKTYKMLH